MGISLVRTALAALALGLACVVCHAAPGVAWRASEHAYAIPPIKLVGADGRERQVVQALNDGRTTVMTFMYSSCATVCPIVNETMVQFESLLGSERAKVNTVSISIDPTFDTVQKLADLARRTGASGAFYTGDPAASETMQRAFDAWRGGDKMNHTPVFLLKAPGSARWTRIDGLVSPRDLLAIYRAVSTRSPLPAPRP